MTNLYGDNNRSASRDYHEKSVTIEHVNIAMPADQDDRRPLVPAQRKKLNQLVSDIVEVSKEEGFVVWHGIHAEIGVNNIGEMTVKDYHKAVTYLHGLRAKHQEEIDKKRLMHLLLKATPEDEARKELMAYCDATFFKTNFKKLSRDDLQQALAWVNEKNCEPLPLEPLPLQAPPAESDQRLTWVNILRTYPGFSAGVFMCGVVVAFLFLRV
ncbi:hypothetical protein C9426_10050 [Serratia sp. S1B]|nr:hypothetical protein C9426_10050 [Serratia sp. S1B]